MSCRSLLALALLALVHAAPKRPPPQQGLGELDVNELVQREVSVHRATLVVNRASAAVNSSANATANATSSDPEHLSRREKHLQDPTDTKKWDYLEKHGISMNDDGDLSIFMGALGTNFLMFAGCCVFFSFARKRWPEIYANNVRTIDEGGFETAPFVPSDTWLGWINAGLTVTVDQVQKTSGLDSALLIEFAGFAMKLLVTIGAPLVIILSPMHYWAGGEGADSLSKIGLNNVKDGRGWLFTIHSFFVWYVVLVTERFVWLSMRRFLHMRYDWLLKLNPPRSTTLLVEGLPESLRTDEALGDYFRKYFTEDSVEAAYVVKNTTKLKPLFDDLNEKKLALEKAVYLENSRKEEKEEDDSEVTEEMVEEAEKAREALEAEVSSLEQQVKEERERIIEDSQLPLETGKDFDGEEITVLSAKGRAVCGPSGFVTFSTEREALLALYARSSADSEEMALSAPPSPCDVRYDDLQVTPIVRKVKNVLGMAAIFGIFVGYTPFIAMVSVVTQMSTLKKIPVIAQIIHAFPSFGVLLQGVATTGVIVLFMGFLPTILMCIYRAFFVLKADAWAQQRLQVSYFWFLVVFILLITAVGKSLLAQLGHIIHNPTDITMMLAHSLPNASHFYLNYLVMQWVVHGMNLTRYIQLLKYLGYRKLFGEERAVELSEPEDQDYYGMGARTARWNLDLILALVFCSITPIMTVVCFCNFLITRTVYGYLVTFAETRKSDSGGPFFVEQMKQVQYGLFIYVILMTGLFTQRAESWFPTWVAGLALIPIILCYRRIDGLIWDSLPLEIVITENFQNEAMQRQRSYASKGASRQRYVQPEMMVEKEAKEGQTA